MALVTSGTLTYMQLASGLSQDTHAWSFWVKNPNWGNFAPVGHFAFSGSVGGSATNGYGAEGGFGSSFLYYGNHVNGPEPLLTTSEVPANYTGWQYFCFVIDAIGELNVYYGLEGANPANILSLGAGNQSIIDYFTHFSPYGVYQNACKIASIKIWTGSGATFNLSQVIAESKSKAPVISSNLFTYLSGDNGTTPGTAQAGSNWTIVGTPSDITTDTDMPTFPAPPAASDNAIFFGTNF